MSDSLPLIKTRQREESNRKKKRSSSRSSLETTQKHGANKRQRSSTHTTRKTSSSRVDGNKKSSNILKGMIIAVSTLQQQQQVLATDGGTSLPQPPRKEELSSEELSSYRAVTDACRSAGAQISSQVHKKVQCVLCTPAALQQNTQRVRKAHKRHIPLIDVSWLQHCLHRQERIPFDDYKLEYTEQITTATTPNDDHKLKPTHDSKGNDKVEEDDKTNNDDTSTNNNEAVLETGWSSPVNVGCCCVCHETGDTNCPWCTDCGG